MARIRSIHPGQWTDEDFVCCSPMARLLILGIRNEADDNGVFEWKPIQIKMRLFPADNVDVVALLEELIENDQVKSFESGGKKYGAIRNFRQYQRPKSPNSVHPVPDDFRNYLGLPDEISEIKEVKKPSFPQKGEIAPQREEGGGRREEVLSSSLRSEDILPAAETKKPAKAKARRKPETPLPNEIPTSELRAEAIKYWQEQSVSLEINHEVAQFRDHHLKKDSRFRDWSAAWRTWFRNAAKFTKERGGSGAATNENAYANVRKWGRSAQANA